MEGCRPGMSAFSARLECERMKLSEYQLLREVRYYHMRTERGVCIHRLGTVKRSTEVFE